MRCSRSFFSFAVAAASASLAVGLIVSCSSPAERATFTDDSGITPAQPPVQNPPPAMEPGGEPVPTNGGDASLEADAPDTCKRTAPSNKCGLAAQCGCTLAETCEVSDNAGNVDCVTAGLAPMGAACVNTSGCARGLTCTFGTCHAYCDNPGSACTVAKTGGCEQVKDTGGTAIPNLSVCRVACDLRDANACGTAGVAGTGVCIFDSTTSTTDCVKGGTRTVGQVCTPTDDCGPTLVCAGTSTQSTCMKWCRVGTTDCGGAAVCGGFSTKVMIGSVEYGGCP